MLLTFNRLFWFPNEVVLKLMKSADVILEISLIFYFYSYFTFFFLDRSTCWTRPLRSVSNLSKDTIEQDTKDCIVSPLHNHKKTVVIKLMFSELFVWVFLWKLPNITVCTCLKMISFAICAGQSSTMCLMDSLSTCSSCLMKSMASLDVLIFLAVWMKNVGEPNPFWKLKL